MHGRNNIKMLVPFASRFQFITWARYLSLWKVFRSLLRPTSPSTSTQWVLLLFSLKIKRACRVNDDFHLILRLRMTQLFHILSCRVQEGFSFVLSLLVLRYLCSNWHSNYDSNLLSSVRVRNFTHSNATQPYVAPKPATYENLKVSAVHRVLL
jgi:hypothetical protein